MGYAPAESCRRSGSIAAVSHRSRATPRSAIPAKGVAGRFAGRCSSVTVTFGHRHSRHDKAGRDPARPLYANSRQLGMPALFCLGRVLAEGGVDFVFLDAGGGISRLIEVLLLGSVAHHAGMRRGGFFL